ncbi:MAG: pyruvate, phosphate dikinase [Nitrosomonadales bacterium]|nr:pyruvate, phosphate dikinase [Nitrosomonadales bacterium]
MSDSSKTKQQVFAFEEGDGKNKKLLGGKGANLCEMTQIGLNVPPGFVISTEACLNYLATPHNGLPRELLDAIHAEMKVLETKTGKRFGDAKKPLLVSVRSGSAMSMPGMMDTILNLGLNEQTLAGEIAQTGDARFGYDTYRRFIQLFGKIALGVPDELFDKEMNLVKQNRGIKEDLALNADDLKEICAHFLRVVQEQTGKPFPTDPYEQLDLSVKAVFDSWMGKRAVDYRREFRITPDMANGTAVNICTMVFGNRGNDSATGVGFTRNPATGENHLYGEYLVNAQGEDVVAGIRTPKPLDYMAKEMPDLFRQLQELRAKLEAHYHEVQDFEFTIERGTLYCLQTRNGKMNTTAMVRSSVEMEKEGLVTRKQALLRIAPESLAQMLFPRLDPNAGATPLAKGLPASPGATSGHAIFDADRAEEQGKAGKPVILVREETKPEDIHGFFASRGILTSRGGKTSHAAVVARGMGKPCVAGAEGIEVNVTLRQATIGETVINEGDIITIDGTTGMVYLGVVATLEAEITPELNVLLGWADQEARLAVMANADTPDDARRALHLGAKGIGLCRTERMFNASDRLPIVLEMIIAEDRVQRQQALDRLLLIQRSDFKGLLKTMAGLPVTIRLLDPPIHEFLPAEQQLIREIAELQHLYKTASGMQILSSTLELLQGEELNSSNAAQIRTSTIDAHIVELAIGKKQAILKKVRALHEVNPMLGHRGVRLGITFPEIYIMQIRALAEATVECVKEGLDVHPEIMVPQVCTSAELRYVKNYVEQTIADVEKSTGIRAKIKFGTMMEVVRACVRADSLATEAEFFSFGTNDLTQATFSFSREDAENKFLPAYNEKDVLHDNPFEVLDTQGVGRLMKLAIEGGRASRPNLKIGICGEHGGHPASIRFCHQIGLNYVSCSAPRVPIARLAAAHAKLSEG